MVMATRSTRDGPHCEPRGSPKVEVAPMYIPKHFEASEETGREIMQAHGWALLVTAGEDAAPFCAPRAGLAGRRNAARQPDRPSRARQPALEAVRQRRPLDGA